jgi:hypothetical protein
MKYEVWENKDGNGYTIFETRNQNARERAVDDCCRYVATFSASSWKRAKARIHKYMAERREEWLKRNSSA